MTTALADWIRTLTGAAIFCAIAFAICPRGRPRQVLSLACGCVMAVALLSPVAGLDVTSLAMAAARYNQAARETVSDAQEGLTRTRTRSHRERVRGIYIGQGGRAGARGYGRRRNGPLERGGVLVSLGVRARLRI